MTQRAGNRLRCDARIEGKRRVETAHGVSAYLGDTCGTADTLDPAADPPPLVRKQPRPGIAVALCNSKERGSQEGGDLEHTAARSRLAHGYPEESTVVVDISRHAADDLAAPHAHEQRHRRGDGARLAISRERGCRAQPCSRLIDP